MKSIPRLSRTAAWALYRLRYSDFCRMTFVHVFKVYGYFPVFRGTGFNTTFAVLDHGTQVRKESVSICILWAEYIIPYAGGTFQISGVQYT
jgi:hypothetical protein